MIEIVIASQNDGKIEEIKNYSPGLTSKVNWLTYRQLGNFPHIEESGLTFMENAEIKARIISEQTGKTAVADDSGLEVDWLDKEPGVFSSRYAGESASDKDNRQKLLSKLKGVPLAKRTARFVCSLVLWDPDKALIFNTSGICEGLIGLGEKGRGGFGYDSLFLPLGYSRTMAQLSFEEKSRISHRGKALASLHRFIEKF